MWRDYTLALNLTTDSLLKEGIQALEDGVMPWVREVSQQVGKRSCTSDVRLHNKSKEGNHGKSSIGQFLFLSGKVSGEPKRVENTSGVSNITCSNQIPPVCRERHYLMVI